MATDKNIIKNWFRNGLKPTQEQFWAWIDSFYHKSDKIPQTQIEGLDGSLANKADVSQLEGKADLVDGKVPESQLPPLKDTTKLDKPEADGSWIVNKTGDAISWVSANSFGKNMANSQLVTTAEGGVTQGYNYTWDTAGYYLYFKGLPDKSNDTTFNKVVVRDSNGQMAESNGKVLFNNIPDIMNASERTSWMKKWTGSYSSLAPVVDVITFPVIEKGGVQELNIWGSNLYIDPEISHVRVKQKSNPSIWHSADFTVKSSGNISFRINTELLTLGEEYVVEVKHGIFITTSNFSFFVVERLFPVDISNLSWTQIDDSNAGIYNRTTRQGNSFFVENLTGATAESGYRNKVVRRFKSAKVLNSGENAIFSFSTNVSYDAGGFEFPRSDFDTIGIGEYLDAEPQTTNSSSIKAFISGGGKPVNIRLQNGNFIAGGNASVLIVKRGTILFTSIQVGNSAIFMISNLIKDINISVEFQTVARYLGVKSVGTYSLDSIYKF
ncbi:hypothetical protein ACXA18_10365 [Riemerella anatipestifer]